MDLLTFSLKYVEVKYKLVLAQCVYKILKVPFICTSDEQAVEKARSTEEKRTSIGGRV